jgi:hypothetical protein
MGWHDDVLGAPFSKYLTEEQLARLERLGWRRGAPEREADPRPETKEPHDVSNP